MKGKGGLHHFLHVLALASLPFFYFQVLDPASGFFVNQLILIYISLCICFYSGMAGSAFWLIVASYFTITKLSGFEYIGQLLIIYGTTSVGVLLFEEKNKFWASVSIMIAFLAIFMETIIYFIGFRNASATSTQLQWIVGTISLLAGAIPFINLLIYAEESATSKFGRLQGKIQEKVLGILRTGFVFILILSGIGYVAGHFIFIPRIAKHFHYSLEDQQRVAEEGHWN